MTRWVVGGVVVLATAAAVAWYGVPRTGPEVVVNAPVTPEPAPPVPAGRPKAEPVLLARVVDVADIDPLLDPPPAPAAAGPPAGPVLTAVGYEEPAPPPPAAGAVPPIPPAAEDDPVEVAPPPREVAPPLSLLSAPVPLEDVRAGWYGESRLPACEVSTATGDDHPRDFWHDWKPFPPDYLRSREGGGVGIFF
ncbi:MAG TPA: hypothetical protein VH092_10525 [Urbifossiella sp.]|jgi:hypothetical protein|nr:hypothetical protein [Urbifossiella sp.]